MNLSSHVVSSIDAATITSHYPRPVGRNSFRPSHGSGSDHEVVVLRTNHGAMGWGLPLAGPWDAQQILGRNVAELIDPGSGVLDPAALNLDYPLHDLAAKILDSGRTSPATSTEVFAPSSSRSAGATGGCPKTRG